MPKIEIVNTGTELLMGRTLNTHQQWLCRQLNDHGYEAVRQTAIADTGEAIQEAVRESLARADLVICTGGLGPTSDDLTRDCLALLFNRALREAPEVWRHIIEYFKGRNREAPETTRVQAQVPDGAEILMNRHGTAPGLYFRLDPNPFQAAGRSAGLLMLPGPPRELRPMFLEQALPLVRRDFPLSDAFAFKIFRTTGIGESQLQETLIPLVREQLAQGLEIGYCSNVGRVDARFSGRGMEAARLIAEAERIFTQRFKPYIYGEGDEPLEAAVILRLTSRRETLSLAESCTGGHIANRLTDIPGASAAFLGGCVTYSNESKTRLLGVKETTLEHHGAVSEDTAREMALGALERFGSNYALSVTGIAGPSGGTPEKPAGTVCLALADKQGVKSRTMLNPFDRETFKQVTTQQALEMLRRRLTASS